MSESEKGNLQPAHNKNGEHPNSEPMERIVQQSTARGLVECKLWQPYQNPPNTSTQKNLGYVQALGLKSPAQQHEGGSVVQTQPRRRLRESRKVEVPNINEFYWGSGVYYTIIIIIRSPQNPILIKRIRSPGDCRRGFGE